MESKVTIGEGKAAFPPGGAGGGRRAEGTCRGRFLSSFPVPPSRPPPPHPHAYSRRPRQLTRPVPARFLSSESPAGPRAACGARPRRVERDARRPPVPAARPTDPHLPTGARSPTAMTGFPTTPPPAEELMATTILQATEALSPEAEASTALIAVVITVVFLTLLSVVILIFFYLYKNKGSYVTYEPADGEPGAVVLMENDSAKGREKEEYFI
uniref:Uncharacterized protein n=2 Tax=Ovis aries TaxID=9940 RepID=A0AC11C4Z8_SHEEP